MPATYTIQTRSDDGTAQPVTDDTFTLSATCAQEGRDNTISYMAAVTADATGLYTATFTPEYWCNYDVVINMENDYTSANVGIQTTVSADLTLRVIDNTTVPGAATVESQPSGDVEVETMATYTIQTRSEDGRAQPVTDDVFTLTATCAEAGRDNTISYTATVTADATGLYTATFSPEYWCVYDIDITMEDASGVPTAVGDDLTLIVIDNTTLPSAATIVSQPEEDVEAGKTATYVIQTRSEDGRAQPVDDDMFTVSLTCTTAEREQEYTTTATHVTDGLYQAVFVPEYWCDYDVLITMENENTANSGLSTTVSDD